MPYILSKLNGKTPPKIVRNMMQSSISHLQSDKDCWTWINTTTRKVVHVGRKCKRPTKGSLAGARRRRKGGR